MALGLAAGHALAAEGDYIVAIVNQEVVTAAELQQRIALVREEAARAKATLPPPNVLRKQALDTLIDERVLVTNARDSGSKIDAAELDRAVANIAAQNQLTMPQLRDRLRAEGIDYGKFRDSVKDKMLVERVREREVANRIKISDAEIDALIEQRLAGSGAAAQFNIAQILVSVPDGADVARRRREARPGARGAAAGSWRRGFRRCRARDFRRRQSGQGRRDRHARGRSPARCFRQGGAPAQGRRGRARRCCGPAAGFHILKLVDRREVGAFTVQQVHARHILLRPSAELTADAATRRLTQFKRDILAGKATFEQLARANSEDSSGEQGGDLGWSSPGQYVPEFEDAIARLDIGGISDPVTSRFGVHLIQLLERRDVTLDRKQQREQARNVLREKKFEDAYLDWVRDLRGEAYIELRDPPQ